MIKVVNKIVLCSTCQVTPIMKTTLYRCVYQKLGFRHFIGITTVLSRVSGEYVL